MERGREGRRGGVGGGPVSAPRRPRTSGFKDATVGEDCDDLLDDAHNQRLRERTSKKDSSSGQGVISGSIGSASRNKRKRQNSQEVQAQVRSNIADEVDETTEDTEMGASEDDDDPPPPPFPRRMGKSRPQGKFLDDGISADLPAVPRKARTATLKRNQESPVVDALSSHGSAAVSRTPPLSNAPSSSSVASLKPGRRTKPCSSKPRAAKVPKVSQTTPISESEVEVAEALYDLAFGIFQPPLSQEEKSETKTDPKSKSEPRQDLEIKSEPKVSVVTSVGQSSPPRPPPPASAASVISAPSAITSASVPSVAAAPTLSMSIATPPPVTSPVTGPVTTSPATQATTPSPVLSPSPPPPPPPPASAPPPAEAPKRKRPRIRAKLEGESGSSTQSRAAGSIVGSSMAPSSCGMPPPIKSEPEQVSKSNSPTAERIPPGTEACEPPSATPSAAASPVVTVTTSTAPTLLVSSPPPTVVQRHNSLEKKAPVEKKGCKVETSTVSAPPDKKMNSQPERKVTTANVASPPTASSREAESVGHVTSGNEPATKLELGKRSAQQTSPAPDTGRPIIDLMVPPVSKPAATTTMDRTTEPTGTAAKDTAEKPNLEQVDSAAPPPEASWMDREKERDKEREREREKERERERERERDIQRDKERERERDIQRDKERERERDIQRDKERERERDIQRDKERERERDIQRDKERERERDIQRDKERERERDVQRDKERELEKEREREREREREKEKERQRERENHREISQRERENQKEVTKERERKEDREKPEVCKQQPPPQRAGKVGKSELRGQKAERAASANTTSAASSFIASAPSVVTTGTGCVSSSGVSLPLSVGVTGWPVGLPPIGYYASTAGAGGWPGAASLQGTGDDNASASVQLSHPYVIQPSRQPWKRCATHVYIAHFIDVQQNFQRQQSYLQAAAYQNTASLYGAKTYNLNHPLPPPSETLFSSGPGGPLAGGMSGAAGASVVAGGGGSVPGLVGTVTERSLGPAALAASAQGKERVYMEAMTRKQTPQSTSQHQPTQMTPSLSLQAGPGVAIFGPQTGSSAGGSAAASTVTVANGGVGANSGLGTGSTHPNGSATAPTGSNIVVPGPGTGAGGGGVANHAAAAQAQYLQGFMQSGGFPFPFQNPHFGPPAFSGPSGHLGAQQAAQFFAPPYYATHLVQHPPSHAPQQLQQSTGPNTGSGSVQKQQQHNPQQAGRNFPPSSPQHQQQSSLAPPSQSPSHSQQQHPQGSNTQQVQRPAERDGGNAGDSSSTAESKFPMSNRVMYGQPIPNVTVSTGNPPASVVLGAGMPNLPTQDYTLINALGTKQAKQQQQQHQTGGQLGSQQQSNLPSQLQQQQHQPQVVVQHHGSGPALQMNLKGIEQQSSQTFPSMSMGAINRGPGPLGLAPVAAVMAPQGHVMLQSMGADPNRGHVQHHQSVVGQPHQHPLQQGQQQQRGVSMQRVGAGPPGEERGMGDAGAFNNRTVRETGDDRKISSKRGMSSSSALNRVDLETSTSMQGSPTGSGVQGSRMTGNVGTTLNLMSPTSAIMSSRSVQPTVGNSLQQSGSTPPGSQSTKQQVISRGKVPPGSGGAPTAAPAQPPLSFSDRNPMGAVLSSKHSGQNLSLPGPNVAPTSQGLRQGPVTQHSLKLSNRPSLGSMPTPSGTAPQAVLAAAIAKAQNQGQQQGRPQGQATTNPGPPSRVPPGSQGNQATSAGMPLPPLPPVSKSAMTSASKSTSSGKGSFPPPHKAPGGTAGKRSTPASGSSHVGSILGPSPLVQSLPSKPSPQQQGQGQHHLQPPPQQQQNVSQLHSQQSQPPQQSIQQASPQGQSLSVAQQQQYQQAHLNSQQQKQVHMLQQQQLQQMRQQMFMHNPSFQPHQQTPGSPMNPHPQQQSVIHQQPQQQPTQQMHQQASPTSSQPQQQQQHSPQLHQQQLLQGGPTSFSGHSTNGTLSLGPTTLTLGTGSNGNSSNSSRASSTDGMANSQGQVPRSHSGSNKGGLAGSGIPNSNSNTQRSHGSGPSFLHGSQFSTGVSSGQQQSSSPRNGPGSPYLQPSSNTGSGGKSGEQKSMSDANTQEQINGMRMLSGSSPSRMATGSLNLQSIPQRPGSGGSSAGKSLGGQFGGSNHGEGIGSRSGLMLSVAPPSMSSSSNSPGTHMISNNGSANSSGPNPSPHLGSDGRPMYGSSSGSANQMTGQGHGGSPHQSSLSSPGGNAANSQSGQSGMLGQTSSSVQP